MKNVRVKKNPNKTKRTMPRKKNTGIGCNLKSSRLDLDGIGWSANRLAWRRLSSQVGLLRTLGFSLQVIPESQSPDGSWLTNICGRQVVVFFLNTYRISNVYYKYKHCWCTERYRSSSRVYPNWDWDRAAGRENSACFRVHTLARIWALWSSDDGPRRYGCEKISRICRGGRHCRRHRNCMPTWRRCEMCCWRQY